MTPIQPLPRSLDPLPDESLAGYVLRLAYRLGLTPQRVTELTGLTTPSGYTPSDRVLDLDTVTRQSFARAARLTAREVAALLLFGDRLDQRYLPLADIDGQPRQPRGIAQQEHWIFTRFTRWCPDCLAGDDTVIQQRHGGPWKKLWRLPVVFACTEHDRLLEHLCPACHQPILTSGQAAGLVPHARIGGLHPAQCRAAPPTRATAARPTYACGARLDTPGTTPADKPSPRLPATALVLQEEIIGLLSLQSPATTHSLGYQVASTCYFTDIRVVATLISASWPAARDIGGHRPLMPELDKYLSDRRNRITLRRQHKTRPPEIVLHDQPPWPADACAALLTLANQILTADDPDTAVQHVRHLTAGAPLGPAWARRITALNKHVSPGLQTALRADLGRWTEPAAGTLGRHLGPTRRANFDHRHIPQRLPDAWHDRHFGDLAADSRRLLRRAAAIRLVRMVEGGSYAQAGNLLGLSETATKTTFINLSSWLRHKANSEAFTAALNALADELDTTTNLIDYAKRRQYLAQWSIPPEEWRALTRHQPPKTRRGLIDWGERKRRFASLIVWATLTSSEHLLAPTTILPAYARQASNQLRDSLIHEWRDFHKRPWRHHAELAQTLSAYSERIAREIDGHTE